VKINIILTKSKPCLSCFREKAQPYCSCRERN